MKSKELIAKLQELDPSGDTHVSIGNGDIWDLTVEPAYYDGKLQVFEFNEHRHPISAMRTSSGNKIVLTGIYIGDAVDYPDFVVKYESEAHRKAYEHIDQEARRQNDEIEISVDRSSFAEWVFRKIQTIRKVPLSWVGTITKVANDFYDANCMGPDNPITKVRQGKSYRDCREEYFEDAFHVNWDNYSRIVVEVRKTEAA